MSDKPDRISEAVAGFNSPRIRAEARAILEREQRRSLLAKHGYPDLPARGVTGRPGEVVDGWSRRDGEIVRVKLRNHVCELEDVEIDGHADPDRNGSCIYCSKELP